MAAMNDNVYARVRDKMREQNFSEQEIEALDNARGLLKTYARIGGFMGATAAFLIGKSKKFKPFPLLMVAGGGFFLGSQTGFLTGVLSGINSIKSLPDPQRLINIMKEVQMEAARGNIQSSPVPRQPVVQEAQNPMDSFSPDVPDYQQNEKEAWESTIPKSFHHDTGDTVMMDPSMKPAQEQPQQKSSWDKIREQNIPNSTWAKIRMEAQKNSTSTDDIAKARAERAKRLRESSEFGQEELPRTREDYFEQKRATRKNQFGDVLE
ncbi:hypothetical protein RMATCC62417_16593 [Rhizopus microsporus]|nr:hypothetical protein RMATCC62417_16593 [Rhizopus microsporus]